MLNTYDTVELGKMMVAFQNGLDSCREGSPVYTYYREMIVGIAKELKARYAFGTEMLNRKYSKA